MVKGTCRRAWCPELNPRTHTVEGEIKKEGKEERREGWRTRMLRVEPRLSLRSGPWVMAFNN